MFSREEILRSALFAVFGGIITVVVLKLLENEGRAAQGEIREENDLNEADKQPQEHDERLCWEKVSMFFTYSLTRNKKNVFLSKVSMTL